MAGPHALGKAQTLRRTTVNVPVRPVAPPPIAPAPKPDAAVATKYADVAEKNLFSKDRSATVIIDPPKVEIPKPMPPLPVVYGVMGLPSGTKAIMSEKAGAPSTTIRSGESIGEFKVAALDTQNVTFEWNGKRVTRKIDDLIDRSGPPGNAGGAANIQAAPPQVSSQPLPQIQQQNPVQTNNVQPGPGTIGIEIGAPGHSERACTPGDPSPAGTVVYGYKKTTASSPFGTICRWVPAQ